MLGEVVDSKPATAEATTWVLPLCGECWFRKICRPEESGVIAEMEALLV